MSKHLAPGETGVFVLSEVELAEAVTQFLGRREGWPEARYDYTAEYQRRLGEVLATVKLTRTS